MKALVCGGRDFTDRGFVYLKLNDLRTTFGITEVIHGNQRGVDRIAGDWGVLRRLKVTAVDADWSLGKRGGPERNARMLALEPGVVIAFPGGIGTSNMVAQARAAGVRVLQIRALAGAQ